MKDRIFVAGRPVRLRPGDLLQSGGEGMVFAWRDEALKLYHDPTEGRAQKLRAYFEAGLDRRMPAGVLGPRAPITNGAGQVVGFLLERLPPGAEPFKRLSQPLWVRNHGWSMARSVRLLAQVHQLLVALHQQGLVVGDLNDQNLFFAAGPHDDKAYWIDVDSFQFGGFPCPVALETFLDPHLYGVADFAARPRFTTASDWYAFAVLAIKLLLLVHPYGGVHPDHASLKARALAGVSCLDPAVVYPASGRPRDALTPALQVEMKRIFGEGERGPFPRALLEDALKQGRDCPRCGLLYSHGLRACPGCRARNEAPRPAAGLAGSAGPEGRLILAAEGTISAVFVGQTGQIQVIECGDGGYRLHRGGPGGLVATWPLFAGGAGFRFAAIGRYLAVGRRERSRLLLVEPTAAGARVVATLETARFAGTPVFAGSGSGLYRVAGGALLRGTVQSGGYAEAMIADARRDQTQIWGASHSRLIAGMYRLWGEHHLFLADPGHGVLELAPPATPAVALVDAVVDRDHVAFCLWPTAGGGLAHTMIYDGRGRLVSYWTADQAEPTDGWALRNQTVLRATDAGIVAETAGALSLLGATAGHVARADRLIGHPRGVLSHGPDRVWFWPAA